MPASGVVIDVGLLGESEARTRVLALYRPGVLLQSLDDTHWLVTFAEPLELDAALAPGLVLESQHGRLIGAPALGADADSLAFYSLGEVERAYPKSLPLIDPSDWLDVSQLAVERLGPLSVRPPAAPAQPPALPAVNLRRLAHVPDRSPASIAIADEMATGGSGAGRGGGVLRRSGPVARGRSALSAAFARLVLRSPLAGEVSRRHAKYLERLHDQFSSGDLDEALRNAIPLGALGRSALTLRVPARRTDIRIGFGPTPDRASVPWGANVYQYLLQTYRLAAERLEQAGRIEEAAFVYAELLNSPQECIALLERHRRFRLAAEVAEDRRLDPTLVVRLWWLAGDRGRAITLARRHAAFAPAIERLMPAEPELARELRLEWVRVLDESGDLAGAVEAAWPDLQTRHLARELVARGLDLPGPTGAAMHAYWLGLESTADALDRVRVYLDSIAPGDWSRLRAFLSALVASRADPQIDREVCTLALRKLVASGRRDSDASTTRAYRELRQRADHALVADLPPAGRKPHVTARLECPELPPGLVAILDAAPMPDERTLVALGEHGCRLLTAEGRVAARWDVPTHSVVLADHGGTAILISRRADLAAVHVLQLETRKLRFYGSVRATRWADTFDGSTWAVVGGQISIYDMLAAEPAVVWRELETGAECRLLARDEAWMSALVLTGKPGGTREWGVWKWDLPRMRLRGRGTVDPPAIVRDVRLLSDATLLWTLEDDRVVARPLSGVDTDVTDRGRPVASQGFVGWFEECGDGSSEVRIRAWGAGDAPTMAARLDSDGSAFRAVGGRIAAWDRSGRLFTAEMSTGRLITATRLLA